MNKSRFLPLLAYGFVFLSACTNANDNQIETTQKNNYPVDSYPSEIQKLLDDWEEQCFEQKYDTETEETITFKDGFLTQVDVTGDGINDYIVDINKAKCAYSASFWGNYPPFHVYQASQDNNAIEIYSNGSFIIEDEPKHPRVVSNNDGYFDIQYVGSGDTCGQTGEYSFAGMESCEVTLRWNKTTLEMEQVDTRKFNF